MRTEKFLVGAAVWGRYVRESLGESHKTLMRAPMDLLTITLPCSQSTIIPSLSGMGVLPYLYINRHASRRQRVSMERACCCVFICLSHEVASRQRACVAPRAGAGPLPCSRVLPVECKARS